MHPKDLPQDQLAANADTYMHIERLRNLINVVIVELLHRGERHDQTKLAPPEVEPFTRLSPMLAKLHFGTPEYEESRLALGPALEHHYANNRHHPEFFKQGVEDMNLIDVLEMLIDWKASSERQLNGNIRMSIEKNTDRYRISPQLRRIMENTVPLLEVR